MRRTRRRAAIGGVFVLALVLVGGLALAAVHIGRTGRPTAAASTTTATAPPPFSTPTPSAPKPLPVEPGPAQPVASDPKPTVTATANPGGGKAQVQVVVTYADAGPSGTGVEVDGFVAGIVESHGRCTLRLTNGQRTAEVSGDALPNASTTSCGALVVPADQVSSGTWSAVLSYASPTSAGSSAPTNVEVR